MGGILARLQCVEKIFTKYQNTTNLLYCVSVPVALMLLLAPTIEAKYRIVASKSLYPANKVPQRNDFGLAQDGGDTWVVVPMTPSVSKSASMH